MYKIYSRPRIRLPNSFQNRNGREKKLSKKLAMIIIVLIIAFSTMKYVLNAVSPIFDTLCESKAKSIATNISNEKAIEVMKDYTYERTTYGPKKKHYALTRELLVQYQP